MNNSPITSARHAAISGAIGKHVQIDVGCNSVDALRALCGEFREAHLDPRHLSFAAFTAELVYNAINYSYWGATCNDRPGGSSSTIRAEIFAACGLPPYPGPFSASPVPEEQMVASLLAYADSLIDRPIPLAVERRNHIVEVLRRMDVVRELWRRVLAERCDPDSVLFDLVTQFQGFASDPFFKRAFLWAALLQRVYGRAIHLASVVPLPADYQVPKVLRAAGVLVYSPSLAATVDSCVHIEAGSLEETEIRATSILAVQKIASLLRTSEAQVDDWLWAARDRITGNFHLTRTTWY